MRCDAVVGHVPRVSLFLHQEDSITCQRTGYRRYSDYLVQGGLEIPCVLRFEGNDKLTAKAKKLMESTLSAKSVDLLVTKKRKVTDTLTVLSHTTKDSNTEVTKQWVRFGRGFVLTIADKECILNGENSMIITST